jgi:hypothetical protein
MPSSGRKSEPEAQNAIEGGSFAEIHAMSAKVGEAARASQRVAPRGCPAVALALVAPDDVVIVGLPIDLQGRMEI